MMRRAISRRRSLAGKVSNGMSAAAASRQPFHLDLTVVHARDLHAADLLTSDPYARVFVDDEFVGQTNIVSRSTSPIWNYPFKIPLLHPYVVLRIELMDYDDLSQDDPLGYVELKVCDLKEGVEQSHTLQVQDGEGTLHITTKFKTRKLVKLLITPKNDVDPTTLAPGAVDVIDAYGTPHVCLDYIVETPYVRSHMHIPLVNDLLYDINCILLASRVETALLSAAYLTYPSNNRFTHRVIEVSGGEDDASPVTTRASRSPSESPHRRRRFLARLRERIFKSNTSPKAQATLQQAFKLGDAIAAPDLGPLGAVVGRALHAGTASTSLSATGEFKFPFSFILRTDVGDWEFVAPDEATYWRWVLALTRVLNYDAPPEYTFRSILRKRRRHGVASGGAYEYHDRWCEVDMHSRLFRYGDAETRMTKHFPLDSIRQINLSRDHHDPKHFLFACKLARAFVPPLLTHKKKGTLTVSFHLIGETFRATSPTTSAEAWEFAFDSALTLEEVKNKNLSVSLSLKSGLEHTRLGEARVPLSRLLTSDPYSASKEQSHIIPLSVSHAQLKVTIRRGEELLAADSNGLSDPYCVVAGLLKDGTVGEKYKTSVCKATVNPVWHDDAFFFGSSRWSADDYSHIRVTVFDKDRFSADNILGVVYIPVSDFPATEETRMFPVQRHEDMTNVLLSTSLGQLEVSLQSVTVDSEIVAEAPAIALQIVTKAEYCDEFSATWPANTLDSPQATLHVAVAHDCLSIREPQPATTATSSIRSCCHRLNSDVTRLDVWENERLVDGVWRPSEPSTAHPYDPHFLSDDAASSHFLGDSLADLEPLDGYEWAGNWEPAESVEGRDNDGWIYGDDFVRMTINRTVSANPTVRRRLWQRLMRRQYFVKRSRPGGDSEASAAPASVSGSPRQHRRLPSAFRRKHSSAGSLLHLHPDYDPLTRTASVSWDNVEYVRVLTPSTLYVQLRSAALGPVEMAPLELIVGPCPAHRLAALMLERKSLLGFRVRLQDLMSMDEGSDNLEAVLSLLSDFATVIPTCEQLVEDLVKQPGTRQEAEIVQQRVVRMRLYQSLLLTRQHRSDISTENYSNYIDKQISHSLLASSTAPEGKSLQSVQASIFRMRRTLALYERLVAECFLCGGQNRESVIRRIECTVNKILPLVLSTLAQHMGSQSTLQQLSGQESKMKLVEFFILEDDAILRPLRTLIGQFGFTIEPSAVLSGYLEFDALLGWYTYLLEEEMKMWIKQTVRVAATGTDAGGSEVQLPWTVAEQPTGQYQSTIPEDVAFALQTYIDDMAQDLSVGALNTTAKDRFTAFQDKILSAVAGGLAWLAREYYDASLSSLSLDHQFSDDDFRKVVGFLAACINDATRILDVYVLSLEAEGMNSMELDELDAEYSDMMLHAAECIARLLLANNSDLLGAKAWLARWDTPDTVSALHQITLDLETDLKHLRPMIPAVWVDKVASLCVERIVVLFLQFVQELSSKRRPPLTDEDVARLEDDVQLVVDTFRSGPASRKAAHLQDLYALLCSPIRNGNARGEVFWEALGRLWARTNRHICMSQYLAMCLRLRAEKPDDEDPVWFVADATNWHSDAMLEGFDAELLLRVLEGEKGGHTSTAVESKARTELLVTVHQAIDLLNVERIGKSDPYCRLKLADQEHRTSVIKNSLDPVWNETFRFAVPTTIGQDLTCELWDYNRIMPHQPLGHFVVSLAGLEVSDREQWYDVKNGTGRVLLSMRLRRLES